MAEPVNNLQLSTISANPLSMVSWERLLKYYGISIVVSMGVILIIMLIGSISGSAIITLTVGFVVVLSGIMLSLSMYERWRGCYTKN